MPSLISGPALVLAPREEWPDADFDLPEGDEPIHASDVESDKDDAAEDWDLDFGLGKTGGASARPRLPALGAGVRPATSSSQMITIRPPLPSANCDLDDDDEGLSTIKATATLKPTLKTPAPPTIDEDIESDFAFPSDMTQLSLRPLSLHHQSSRSSFEWGDRDQTSSSQSSDAYTSLGFADTSPSSNATSASLPETETEEDEEDDLDGLVIPTGLFESGQGRKHLVKMLEMKRKLPAIAERPKVASPDPDDDFELGLIIDDDAELNQSRLQAKAAPTRRNGLSERSKSAPATRPSSSALRPPSRTKGHRAKSPVNPPPAPSASSHRHLRHTAHSASGSATPTAIPRPAPPMRAQTLAAPPIPIPATPASFLAPKPMLGSGLRGQKSHGVLKPPSPPTRGLTRKASLSSLIDSSAGGIHPVARYEAPTAASRGKLQGRVQSPDQAGPSTPSPSPAALRLTMPASSSRLKARPNISSLFPSPASATATHNPPLPGRAPSPLPPRPSSVVSTRSRSSAQSPAPAPAPKVLRRPKRPRTYGDGTELDGFADLPTDRDKESRFRVLAKGRATYSPPKHSLDRDRTSGAGSSKLFGRASPPRSPPRPKAKRPVSENSAAANVVASLRQHASRLMFPSRPSSADPFTRKKKPTTPPKAPQQKRKPTLIRNLGGAGAPKVVGEMKWNPQTLRWEGNDQALRDFDAAVGTSARPALITHLTGGSIGVTASGLGTASACGGSPVAASLASGARVVGTMVFDPAKMCWISTLPPDEDEPDVFAQLADDEQDEDAWEARGGTIRAALGLQGVSGASSTAQSSDSSAPSSLAGSGVLPSPGPSPSPSPSPGPGQNHTRGGSESGSERGGVGCGGFERGSRASLVVGDIDEAFRAECRAAEARHRVEMLGWRDPASAHPAVRAVEPNRTFLFEIRALATRQY